MKMQTYKLLEDQGSAIMALARAAFGREHSELPPSSTEALDAAFARAFDSFLDMYLTDTSDEWDKCTEQLLALDSTGIGVLLSVPFAIARAACDRTIEMSNASVTTIEELARTLSKLQQAGDRMATRLVELYQDRVEAR